MCIYSQGRKFQFTFIMPSKVMCLMSIIITHTTIKNEYLLYRNQFHLRTLFHPLHP